MGKTNLVFHSSQASYSSKTFQPLSFFPHTLFRPRLGDGDEGHEPQIVHLGIPLGFLLAAMIVPAPDTVGRGV